MKGYNSTRNVRIHSLEKERELVIRLKLERIEDAKSLLQEILNDIYVIGIDNIGIIKVKVLELILVLSRAIVDGGADYEKVSQINARLINKITYSKTLEEISITAIKVFQSYIESRPVKKPNSEEVISTVKKFIIENYHRNLTLEEIAKSVYISPWYLSHIFKEAVGVTVIDYLTKVRIEKAKELLRNRNYTIYEISEKLGYKAPGYFSKVFRRREGWTPSQFRKLG